ncbi:MAG TPA: TonB-dependent receptor [Draconibacterium sp.]|nr:TonB-dependent receptor [Draconibacterium sp.]
MKTNIIFLWLVVMSLFSQAQKSDMLRDTFEIKEVKISANLPLDDNDVVDFYRTNQFSTIDNINARLDGMSLIKRGAYALEPQLNGFSAGQLNITIDGMKMFGACTDKMDPITSYIEPTNLKNISINQGTSGNHTGCNIGGSVDMTLQEPNVSDSLPFYSSLGFGYGSVSKSKNVLFSTGYNRKKWAWIGDGVYRKNENYTDGNNVEIPFSQFEKLNIHSAFKYSPNNISNLKADFLFDNARDVGYPALPMDVSLARATLIALDYQRNSKNQLKAKVYFNKVYHVMDDTKRDSLYFLDSSADNKSDSVYMRMDMPGESSTLGAYFQYIIPWNSNNRLMIKADNYTNLSLAEMTMHMRYAGYPPEPPMYMQTWPEMLRNVSGIFVENTTSFSDKFSLMVNVRIDYNIDILQSEYGQLQFSIFNYTLDKTSCTFIKSLNASLQYYFTKDFSVNATAGYSERMPTISELYGFYLYNAYDGYDYIGNPYIKPERSNFFNLAFLLAKPKLKVNLNQSFSFVNDFIMGVTDTVIPAMNFYANGIRIYTNIPNAMLYSADFQVLYKPLNSFSVFLHSKYTFGELNSGTPMPLIPPLKNIVAVQYEKNRFSILAESESALAQNRINVDYGESKTPAFNVFNIKSGYSIPLSKTIIDIGFSISNIFNTVYYEHLDWDRINRPGRSFDLLLKLSF